MVPGLCSYRGRLLVYVSLLLAFLLGVLVFSYYSSRAVIMGEAENNAARIARQIEGQLAREGRDLLERALMVRDNATLVEYVYVVLALGASDESLSELYQRQFGWLPLTRVVLLSPEGGALLGAEHADLVDALRAQGMSAAVADRHFYFHGERGVELVATAALRYRSQALGLVAITRAIDQVWLDATREMSGGHLFLVADGVVTTTTAGRASLGAPFAPGTAAATLADDDYLVRQIALTPAATPLPALWFALSDAQLTKRLGEQRNVVLILAIAGAAAILLVGLMMLRNFSGPLGRLVNVMQQVGRGRFPEIPETAARDEIGYLINQFSAMVGNLREKQAEIERVHAQLEQQAITDALTGYYNRRYLYSLYPKLWSDAHRSEKRLNVLLIDLDLFKQVNDQYGHLVGDQVLVHFAAVLESCCRVSDFIFRLGGEEFLVLTGGDLDGACCLAEKIRAAVEGAPLYHEGDEVRVTVSIGVGQAQPTDGASGPGPVLRRADRALYAAKQGGRNRVVGPQAFVS